MALYSYLLISLPEGFAFVLLIAAMFGMNLVKWRNKLVLLGFVIGLFTYVISLWVEDPNLRIMINLIGLFMLIWLILRLSWKIAFVLCFVGILSLMIAEIVFGILLSACFAIDFQSALQVPWQRIWLSWPSMGGMYITAFILLKTKKHMKLPGLSDV